ncbi:LON peptidase substrate-binding domain-containing protein [Croceivirga sp. JEA036]|uniref:LON peptidase substrate-binding domain-containing protein n=1 Tax=Croceivirga sp. JEA036 TaxID=2721162 RepID=UPI001439B517|nr:LON peptidase substrate-binding domain-containing protein [Croceivirga sp. JEA036]NJB37505.1 ATP-dependent protease [Croceivirga sp. JEA036]
MRLPFFPLKSIFFPGETVPIHVFEERYQQLIKDCRKEAITFGVPVYHNKEMHYGTEVQLVEVVNTYDGGEMDVLCVARQVFKVKSFEPNMEDRLYAGGVVEFLETIYDATAAERKKVYDKIRLLYKLMQVAFPPVPFDKFNSYAFAHKMGLSFEQEFSLLKMNRETDRLRFLNSHLEDTIAVLKKIDHTKMVIEMNGHFKNFDPLDFKDYGLK